VLYFFLSYAREDDPAFIRRFFEDLSRDVRDLSGADRMGQVGFLDEQSIQPGQRWVTEVNDALSTCRCFVALTSPRYFRRDYCGREWWVFNQRLQIYEQQRNRAAPSLLPINWIPTIPMHPVAAEIQRPALEVDGRPYTEYGLRQLLDLKRFRHEYRTFVFDLARKIVSTARAHSVPRPRHELPLRHAFNIFAEATTPGGQSDSTAGDPARAPRRAPSRRYVHFVIVAGSRDEMAATRRKLEYYGQHRVDWAPYWPATEGPLGNFATRVASEQNFDCAVTDITQLRQRIERAKRRNQVVVLLVDTWALELDDHQTALAEYDRHSEETTALVIPFSATDTETLADTTFLQSRVAAALPNSLKRRDPVMLRQNVPTHDQFSASLEEILEVAMNRIFRRGTVNSRVPSTPPRTRPILEGPASTTDGPGQ
jgi:FxsC-like protein